MSQQVPLRYRGTLYFDDSNPIEVRALIVHADSLSFDLMAGWGSHGIWSRSGIARRVGSAFHSEFGPSHKDGVVGYRCKIVFYGIANGEVEGAWIENGEEREFSGSLEVG